MKRGGIQDGVLPCYFSSEVPTFLTMFFFSTQAPVVKSFEWNDITKDQLYTAYSTLRCK